MREFTQRRKGIQRNDAKKSSLYFNFLCVFACIFIASLREPFPAKALRHQITILAPRFFQKSILQYLERQPPFRYRLEKPAEPLLVAVHHIEEKRPVARR